VRAGLARSLSCALCVHEEELSVNPAIVLLVALALVGCDCRAVSYSTLDAAKADGAVRRGWIPEFVPASARDIRMSYDLDTNEIWLRFAISPDAIGSMLSVCKEDRPRHWAAYPRVPCSGWRWWPSALTRGAENTPESTFDTIYWCERSPRGGWMSRTGGFIVVDSAASTAYYWETDE
jgi:hypothetical protein